MTREIHDHEVTPASEQIKITATDEPGPGGANGSYVVTIPAGLNYVLEFQKGFPHEVGVNGITMEVLLAICIDRLRGFQAGPFGCPENAAALENMESALKWLAQRTRKRAERGVEGKMEK